MDEETDALVQRWIIAFCEMPTLIDPDLMRAVLADLGESVDTTNSDPPSF